MEPSGSSPSFCVGEAFTLIAGIEIDTGGDGFSIGPFTAAPKEGTTTVFFGVGMLRVPPEDELSADLDGLLGATDEPSAGAETREVSERPGCDAVAPRVVDRPGDAEPVGDEEDANDSLGSLLPLGDDCDSTETGSEAMVPAAAGPGSGGGPGLLLHDPSTNRAAPNRASRVATHRSTTAGV